MNELSEYFFTEKVIREITLHLPDGYSDELVTWYIKSRYLKYRIDGTNYHLYYDKQEIAILKLQDNHDTPDEYVVSYFRQMFSRIYTTKFNNTSDVRKTIKDKHKVEQKLEYFLTEAEFVVLSTVVLGKRKYTNGFSVKDLVDMYWRNANNGVTTLPHNKIQFVDNIIKFHTKFTFGLVRLQLVKHILYRGTMYMLARDIKYVADCFDENREVNDRNIMPLAQDVLNNYKNLLFG